MKKTLFILFCLFAVYGCSSHDPILPGVRHNIFDDTDAVIENSEVPQLSDTQKNISGNADCKYTQGPSNSIWLADKKIYSGFVTTSSVKSNQSPICDGGFLYTGFSTGEIVKINPSTKKIIWATDVFRLSNLTGGASVVDIVAHVGVDKNFVYGGGLGDAFCKLDKQSGDKIWCVNISVPVDFIIVDDFAFVVGTDNNLYAINTKNGKICWKTTVKKQVKPIYENNIIVVGKQRINTKNGDFVK